ncbi:MAG: hypothetical protein RLP14_04250 [Owenweeksia sp.]
MRSSRFKKALLLALLIIWGSVQAQDQKDKPNKVVLISPSAAIQFPGGDLEKTFGTNYTIGIGAGLKTNTNWIIDANFHFMFGREVKNREEILSPILSSRSNIFNQTGNYAQVNVFERGLYGVLEGTRVLSGLGGVNANSGPTLSLGVGYIYHWIEFDNLGNDTPQILDEYAKGYDQLRGGFLLKQSIGYLFLSKRRRINFKLSFEVLEAFTQNLRGINYSTGKNDTETHLDLIYGIRLNWYLPIYQKSSDQFYYD